MTGRALVPVAVLAAKTAGLVVVAIAPGVVWLMERQDRRARR